MSTEQPGTIIPIVPWHPLRYVYDIPGPRPAHPPARVFKNNFGGVATATFHRAGPGVTDPLLSDGSSTFNPGISMKSGGTTKIQHADRLGTNKLHTDASAAVVGTQDYDAFGCLAAQTGLKNSLGFAGEFGYQEDAESGLKLLGHRFYDATAGRFLTRDPAKEGLNWYSYCGNNPLAAVDSSGLNLTVIGQNEGVEQWDWFAEHVFGVGGRIMRQPSKAQLLEALINEPDGADVMIWGHGGDGYINLGSGETLHTSDIEYVAAERARRGKGKLGIVTLRACHTCQDKNWVNAWLGACRKVEGYCSVTTDGPMLGWTSPISQDPPPTSWGWPFGKVKHDKKGQSKGKAVKKLPVKVRQ